MDTCTLCKAPIPGTSPETWTTLDGQAVEVARSISPSIVAHTSVGEFAICEACYLHRLPSYFTPQDLAEIHYQFGLEYRDRQQFDRCVESLTEARGISETADIVAALAAAQDDLGCGELAVDLYRRALELDPSHFMARENLKCLTGSPGTNHGQ